MRTSASSAGAKASRCSSRAAAHQLRAAREALAKAPQDASKLDLRATVEAAQHELHRIQGEKPMIHADADADVVANVVAAWTGIPVGKMKTDTISAILTLEDRLRERVQLALAAGLPPD